MSRRPESEHDRAASARSAGEPRSRFVGFVMTYRRPHVLPRTLESLLSQSRPPEHLLVVDNGASAETAAAVRPFAARGVEYRPMDDNLGPAGAAAYALEALGEVGYDWVYWGGDDGPPSSPRAFERLLAMARGGGGDLGAVAASGVRWDWRRGAMLRVADRELAGPVEVDAIPGGSVFLLRRRAVDAIGLPQPQLFWGLEDIEYCLRLRRGGFRLWADGDQMREARAASDRLRFRHRRSPVPREALEMLPRTYYTTRNYVYLMSHTFGRRDLAARRALKELVRALASWARGPRFGAAFTRCQLRAVHDGLRGRMGRTRELNERRDMLRGRTEDLL